MPKRLFRNFTRFLSKSMRVLVYVNPKNAPINTRNRPVRENITVANMPTIKINIPAKDPVGPKGLSRMFFVIINYSSVALRYY